MLEEANEVSEESFNDVLTTLPAGLDEAYSRILNKNVKNQSDRNNVMKMLQIIVTAKRPLNLKELSIAWKIQPTDTSMTGLDIRLKSFNVEQTLRAMCGSFVRVIASRVHLAHQTAREFLFKSVDGIDGFDRGAWKHCLDPVHSDIVLAEICVWYLAYGTFEKLTPVSEERHDERTRRIDQYKEAYEFLDYAARNWATHFREGESCAEPSLVQKARQLCNPRSERFRTWFQVYWSLTSQLGDCPLELTPLAAASFFGQRSVLQLLPEHAKDVNVEDLHGRTPLYWVAEFGHVDVAQILISQGADVTHKQAWDSSTPLHRAAWFGWANILQLMVNTGVDLDTEEDDGATPLQVAAQEGREAVVRLLLENHANANAFNGESPLHHAAERGSLSIARLLIDYGADMNTLDSFGLTPLHRAASQGHVELIKFLLDEGADVNTEGTPAECHYIRDPDYLGGTPLHEAAKAGNLEVLRLLMDRGAQLDARNIRGESILDRAIAEGHETMADILLDKYSNFPPGHSVWSTALQAAILSRSERYFNHLIQVGANMNASGGRYGSALGAAVRTSDKNIVIKLLDMGANPNVSSHCSALQAAAEIGNEELVRILIDHGAELNSSPKECSSALQAACSTGNESIVAVLLERGANPN
ncbi:hypothetical protein DL770_010140 [Monosporascus sp. CRB-9-2]|nr:hypothetical protein DL770_010140 [Monosporascus sp. CRB-9-2]